MASRDDQGGGMESSTGAHIGSTEMPTAKYSALTNSLRVLTTGGIQCSMFCGGKGCKYDNPSKWTDDQMAIKGLFSHWVTKRILAMSRPSTDAVKKYDIISQFKQYGIKTVVNLQTPGEHAHCGLGLEPDGFSYIQQDFMDENIFFYNFGWEDYGVKSLTFILDMVKVMSFAIKQGKVAVHCHAGLGRTGVLIACYLIYAKRFDGDHAIHFVREKRPGSIQTKGQVECCQQFARFLIPLRNVFSSCDPTAYPFTLQQFINRQKRMLHGTEARELKHIPKIVKIVCARLHELAGIRDVHCSWEANKSESMDVVKTSVPGAFQENRHPQSNGPDQTNSPKSPQRRHNSLDGTEGSPLVANKEYGNRLRQGQQSPLLDLRKMNLNDDVWNVSSSEDDVMSQGRPSTLREMSSSRSDSAISSSLGGSLSRLRTSASLLTADTVVGHSETMDVEVVAEALSFDLGNRHHIDDEDDDGEEVDEERTGEKMDGISAASRNLMHRVESLKHNTNQSNSAWKIIATEEDPFVLAALMWSWLEELKEPVLSSATIEKLADDSEDCDDILKSLSFLQKCEKLTLECILKTFAGLRPLSASTQEKLMHRFINAVTKRKIDGRYQKSLSMFFENYVAAYRAKLPPLDATESARKPDQMQKVLLPKEPKEVKESSVEGTKKKSKGKKKKDKLGAVKKSPRRSPLFEERDDDKDLSDEGSPRQLPPVRRGNILPPIF